MARTFRTCTVGIVLAAGLKSAMPGRHAMPNLWVSILIMASSAIGAKASAEQSAEPLTIQIAVMNEANVPTELLTKAEAQAEKIYARIHIRLLWIGPAFALASAEGVSRRLTLKIVSHSMLAHESSPMGFAIKGANIAYVFHDRMADFASQRQIPTPNVLGHAIAHELGHLLLPGTPHAFTGIMRGHWDRDHEVTIMRTQGLAFTNAEGKLIRSNAYAPPASR